MPKTTDLLTLLVGAGWSDKAVRETLSDLRGADLEKTVKEYRALKRAVAGVGKRPALGVKAKRANLDRIWKLLQSSGSYYETELGELLAERIRMQYPAADVGTPMSKGRLRDWLDDAAEQVGHERLLDLVTKLRNELAHSPRPGWSLKDVR